MKSFLLIIGALLSLAFAEEVVTLTEKNFQQTIDSNTYVLAEFYAPWCGHCKKLAPEYEKAAAALKSYDPKVVIAKVDATEEKELASKFGVKGFPTLKWFVNGEVSDYSGGRTEATIVNWVKKKTGPPATVIKTVEDLTNFKEQSDAVALGFFKDEAEAEFFLKRASIDDDTPYGVCYGDCADVKKAAGAESSTRIMMLQKFDEGKALFEGDIKSTDEIAEFVSLNSLPTIVQFTQQSAGKIFGGAIKDILLIFCDVPESKEFVKIVSEVTPIARAKKGKMMFATIQEEDTRILEFFGITAQDMPTVRIINMDGGAKKYKFTGSEVTTKEVDKFVEDYFSGNLKLDLKSAEIVPESEQGNVRVVVGKDFDKIVNQPGKDVLVEFYAPWCGHCKKLEPEYNELGEYFKDNDNIVIAKVDATENEVEAVQVTGFPTIKFFPADSDEIVDYDGERTKDGMVKWIESHAKSLK